MTHTLILDSEQADLIYTAAEMMHAALAARAVRVDPEQIVSKSLRMSEMKLTSILTQMNLGPLPEWDAVDPELRRQMTHFMRQIVENPDHTNATFAWRELRNFVLANLPRQERQEAYYDAKRSRI